MPALWIAALVRSATARTWRPFVVSVAAVVGLRAIAALVWAIGAIHRARRWPAAAVVIALLAGSVPRCSMDC